MTNTTATTHAKYARASRRTPRRHRHAADRKAA
eukprot:CAMPEP_0176167580 /NCGR_PEP_ID=MMETSP0120_2-20121206/85743_1 /TAXON_ID=160619 /ORGANISM="Kryptoperidinium foliaceum, Strain CCMP 1326" /LENGTH=32 /DNA_ID= /DNA_START= /DNA_END= /DNA_ORIENTATION=